ncbi:lipocalin-like domain-containing protein [Friedmanniella luteola]|uniref:lipocalin-like domain-containing protein n=1 Tax=Friedmanniella luteola TaxID=546871 RepID=UPI0012FDD762|nr:lipocalin-like domain-containing protein [Friedmanniella luteola]
MDLEGSWQLVQWRRIAPDGTVSYPLGTDAEGLLVYTADGRMSVVMTGADRTAITGGDPLGGPVEERAAAYSSCLAYTGTYERQGDVVVHRVGGSLYPNWSDTVQPRTIVQRDGQLVLLTPDQPGSPVNELAWQRAGTA